MTASVGARSDTRLRLVAAPDRYSHRRERTAVEEGDPRLPRRSRPGRDRRADAGGCREGVPADLPPRGAAYLARRLVPGHAPARLPDRPVGLPGAGRGAEAQPRRPDRHLPRRHGALPRGPDADHRARSRGDHRRRGRGEPAAAPAAHLPHRAADRDRHRRRGTRPPGRLRAPPCSSSAPARRRTRCSPSSRPTRRWLPPAPSSWSSTPISTVRPRRCRSSWPTRATSRSMRAATDTSSPRTPAGCCAGSQAGARQAPRPRRPASISTRPPRRCGRWTSLVFDGDEPHVVLVLQAFEPDGVLRRHQDGGGRRGPACGRARARSPGRRGPAGAGQHPRRGASGAGLDRARGRPARASPTRCG